MNPNGTIDISSALISPVTLLPSLGDITIILIIGFIAVLSVVLIVNLLGKIGETFAEYYDFKTHMLVFIALMLVWIVIKIN
jgi:hypothetical protein